MNMNQFENAATVEKIKIICDHSSTLLKLPAPLPPLSQVIEHFERAIRHRQNLRLNVNTHAWIENDDAIQRLQSRLDILRTLAPYGAPALAGSPPTQTSPTLPEPPQSEILDSQFSIPNKLSPPHSVLSPQSSVGSAKEDPSSPLPTKTNYWTPTETHLLRRTLLPKPNDPPLTIPERDLITRQIQQLDTPFFCDILKEIAAQENVPVQNLFDQIKSLGQQRSTEPAAPNKSISSEPAPNSSSQSLAQNANPHQTRTKRDYFFNPFANTGDGDDEPELIPADYYPAVGPLGYLNTLEPKQQKYVAELLEEYTHDRVAQILSGPAPDGLGRRITTYALMRFENRHKDAAQSYRTAQHRDKTLTVLNDPDATDEILTTAATRFLRAKLVEAVTEIDSLESMTALHKILNQLRRTDQNNRRLDLSEAKLQHLRSSRSDEALTNSAPPAPAHQQPQLSPTTPEAAPASGLRRSTPLANAPANPTTPDSTPTPTNPTPVGDDVRSLTILPPTPTNPTTVGNNPTATQ
jgi:hypothetical protein